MFLIERLMLAAVLVAFTFPTAGSR